MSASRLKRQIALAAGAAAILGMGALSACSSDTKEKPTETKAPESSAPQTPGNAPQPPGDHFSDHPEKKVGPVGPGGNNSFSPTVTARPAPTALPGNVVTGG